MKVKYLDIFVATFEKNYTYFIVMIKNIKSIAHIASRSINIGDGAVHYVLDDALFNDKNFNVTKIDSLDYRGLKESELDEGYFSNYDLTVIGGGGMIDGGKSHTKSGIAFPVSPEDIVSTKNKFAIVGIGHNLFQNQEFHNKSALINLVKSFEKREFLLCKKRWFSVKT